MRLRIVDVDKIQEIARDEFYRCVAQARARIDVESLRMELTHSQESLRRVLLERHSIMDILNREDG